MLHRYVAMHDLRRGLGSGLVGGALGLVAMDLLRRATKPLVKERAPRPTDVFLTERSREPSKLAQHVGFGVATAATTHAFEVMR